MYQAAPVVELPGCGNRDPARRPAGRRSVFRYEDRAAEALEPSPPHDGDLLRVAFGLLGIAALIAYQAETRALDRAGSEMIGTARALGSTIQGRFDAAEAALQDLAAMGSYTLREGGPGGFAAQLGAFARAANLSPVSLFAPDGGLLPSSRLSPGTAPPDIPAPPAARQTFLAGRTEIGDLIRGPTGGEHQVSVAVLVDRPDSGAEACRSYGLSLSLAATDLATALHNQELPPGWWRR
ncbi:hypothetical protein JMJ56_04945 [Belnapia sp. T18]|uniref:Uncharacterized protein n=1 Tax=Belnapia arida TaxID=2804533 RepID=A0ABS1TY44_9PROT|nr:hypothetical protein [Belnapia arida]MBL6077344.1 hypothetical protein [Belnapia arida]